MPELISLAQRYSDPGCQLPHHTATHSKAVQMPPMKLSYKKLLVMPAGPNVPEVASVKVNYRTSPAQVCEREHLA
jgi:hypothetical protein